MNFDPRDVAKIKAAGVGTEAALENSQQEDHNGNTAEAQRVRLLGSLRTGPITTLEARRKLDVLHPAARVMELRRQGHNIVTIRTRDQTPEGHIHRVARYTLLPAKKDAEQQAALGLEAQP